MLDSISSESIHRRQPVKGTRREIVGATIVGGQLPFKVGKKVKTMGTTIEALLIFPMTALHFAVAPGRIGPGQFVTDTQPGGSSFKQSGQVPAGTGESVREFELIWQSATFGI